MLVIVAHHYVVSSGISLIIADKTVLEWKDYFLLLFGCGGKIGINCFVLITGYFMCRQQITLRKWLRLLGGVEFYNIGIYAIFVLTGYEVFSVRGAWEAVFPFTSIASNFTGCFLLFYGFIPFLNRLIDTLTEREHLILLGLCLLVYSVIPTFLLVDISFNYITWFSIVYILAAYIRIYPRDWFDHTWLWAGLTTVSVAASLGSVAALATLGRRFHIERIGLGYYMVVDANKVLAVITAVCAFMLFKNLRISYNRVINTLAVSTFGVLLIHTSGETMTRWLWMDVCRATAEYCGAWLPLRAVMCVTGVYMACTAIDMIRKEIIERFTGKE